MGWEGSVLTLSQRPRISLGAKEARRVLFLRLLGGVRCVYLNRGRVGAYKAMRRRPSNSCDMSVVWDRMVSGKVLTSNAIFGRADPIWNC